MKRITLTLKVWLNAIAHVVDTHVHASSFITFKIESEVYAIRFASKKAKGLDG